MSDSVVDVKKKGGVEEGRVGGGARGGRGSVESH